MIYKLPKNSKVEIVKVFPTGSRNYIYSTRDMYFDPTELNYSIDTLTSSYTYSKAQRYGVYLVEGIKFKTADLVCVVDIEDLTELGIT